jgi:hypothetical protein
MQAVEDYGNILITIPNINSSRQSMIVRHMILESSDVRLLQWLEEA